MFHGFRAIKKIFLAILASLLTPSFSNAQFNMAFSKNKYSWLTGSFSGCTAVQPAFTYDGWGACSAPCGGGVQYRNQYCPVSIGGTESRSVTCKRGDGVVVPNAFCKTTQPNVTQTCTRGGGGDCTNPQPTAQACNTQACI